MAGCFGTVLLDSGLVRSCQTAKGKAFVVVLGATGGGVSGVWSVTGTRGRLVCLLGPHELEALSIFHRGAVLHTNTIFSLDKFDTKFDLTYLDGLLVLLEVKRDLSGVQVQEMPDFVGHIGLDFLVASVLQPHLQQSLLRAKRDTGADDLWFLKLLAYKIIKELANFKWGETRQKLSSAPWKESWLRVCTWLWILTDERKENTLPHLIDVVVFLDLDDPDSTQRWFLIQQAWSVTVNKLDFLAPVCDQRWSYLADHNEIIYFGAWLTSHMGTSLFLKKKRSISRGISDGFFM